MFAALVLIVPGGIVLLGAALVSGWRAGRES